jgi:hypothetical protein
VLTIQIFSTSVHPVVQPRRTQQAPATPGAEQGNNTPARRAGQAGVTRDPTQPNGRGFGNFGRGDGGILSAGGIKHLQLVMAKHLEFWEVVSEGSENDWLGAGTKVPILPLVRFYYSD